ncbi:right-handed parallel beta-helix repeat-containing protein [Paraburkholderia rhizosphaerae]|uniref:right-handed parallel beta-helix repeat-containing protein n=1 Tax=Paraburkholderia rhizosphaerae TaxID=480658 RepID=UPI001416F1C0|nr:right-handed parallel beta-helix repeat-containing protein [Paraburkholderia rhizosphaerae]
MTAAATNARESGQTPASNPITFTSPNLSLRDVLSLLGKNKGLVGSSIDSLNIVLAAGTYRLTAPLVLAPDPTWSSTPITITGPTSGRAIITGGKVLSGFTPVTDAASLARLPSAARGSVVVASLTSNGITDLGKKQRHGYDIAITPAPLEIFFRDAPMTVARWPNTGFAKIQSLPNGPTGLTFTVSGGHTSAWQNEPDLEAMGYWARDWADTTLPVTSVDSSGVLTLQSPAPEFGLLQGQRVIIQNALSELDQPGEYYVDRATARVFLWPPAPMAGGDVQASIVDTLLTVNNAVNLTIRNLSFDIARGDGIDLNGGGNILVQNAILSNTGDRGAFSNAGSSGFDSVILAHTGEGGIVIVNGNRTTLASGNAFVTGSNMHDFARRSHAYRPAINVAGVGARVINNTIYSGPHAAIIFTGNNHVISDNEIYNVVTETADAGAIYTGRDWSARGTVIQDNFIHDIGTTTEPQATVGVYLDDEASGTIIRRNVFSRVNQAVFIGGGRDNIVEDNLFANSSPALYVDSRGLSWQNPDVINPSGIFQTALRAVPYNQPPYSTQYPTLPNILQDHLGAPVGNVFNRNIVINGSEASIDLGAQPFVTLGQLFDASSVVFARAIADADRTTYDDFALSPSSPAIASGFMPSLFGTPAALLAPPIAAASTAQR